MKCNNCNVRDALTDRDVCSVCAGALLDELTQEAQDQGLYDSVEEQLDMFEDQSTEVEETPEEYTERKLAELSQTIGRTEAERVDREIVKPWCWNCGGGHFHVDCTNEQDSPRSEQYERQVKEKENKPPLQYIPYGPLEEVARVFGYGAKKYRANLWREEPTSTTERVASALRHVFVWNEGWEDNDIESGVSHLAHAIVQLMMAMEYHQMAPYLDNRHGRLP